MAYKKLRIEPNYFRVVDAYNKVVGDERTPQKWQSFLNECGLQHISFSRLKIVNIKKFTITKLKYDL